MKQKTFQKRALFWILFSLAAGGLSAAVTRDGRVRFETVPQPPLSPPRVLFPIVWSVLLILIGLGFALVLEKAREPEERNRAAAAYAVQMTFFFCWMIWFFGLQWYGFSALWPLEIPHIDGSIQRLCQDAVNIANGLCGKWFCSDDLLLGFLVLLFDSVTVLAEAVIECLYLWSGQISEFNSP